MLVCVCVSSWMCPAASYSSKDCLVRKCGDVISNDCHMWNSIYDYQLIHVSLDECSNCSRLGNIL